MIEFPYFNEFGEPSGQEPFAVRRGPDVADHQPREPLLLNRGRTGTRSGRRASGPPAKSFLGVPILAGDEAIGAISVQSTTEEGRFGEADARLLSTIAANVGVAIQNARLFQEAHRRADEMAALAEVGQEISATLDVRAVLERIGERVQELLAADTGALFLAEDDGTRVPSRSSRLASSPTRCGRTRSSRARESSATSSADGRRSSSTTPMRDPGPSRSPAPRITTLDRAAHGRAADRPRPSHRVAGGLAHRRARPSPRPTSTSSSGCPAGVDRARERPPVHRGAGGARPRPRAPTRPRARSSPR